jgi:hypothetical protein
MQWQMCDFQQLCRSALTVCRYACRLEKSTDENIFYRASEVSYALDHNRSVYTKTNSSVVSEKHDNQEKAKEVYVYL